jgi:hypothetical protein
LKLLVFLEVKQTIEFLKIKVLLRITFTFSFYNLLIFLFWSNPSYLDSLLCCVFLLLTNKFDHFVYLYLMDENHIFCFLLTGSSRTPDGSEEGNWGLTQQQNVPLHPVVCVGHRKLPQQFLCKLCFLNSNISIFCLF